MNTSQLISNRFKLQNLLGQGGMGDVYRALDTQTGEIVAVKALNPEVLSRDPALLERFVREGNALRQLNHPNIVHMIAAVEEQGRHYLVMEFVEGGSLKDVLSTQRNIPAQRAIEISLDLADALTRAHRLGIIHRDLKPANVLLAKDGTPRLADFGIAYMQDSLQLTQSGVLIGTVDYLSPEICQGEPPSELSDIWAFGVMLFEMLAGTRPFKGESLTSKLTAILTQPIPDLAQFAPDVPDALIDLVYRMLEKDPHQRISSVRLVGAELEAILKRRGPIPASQPSSPESRFATPTPAANTPKHNLPAQTTAFVGRQAELTEVTRLLKDPQVSLLTVIGAGGVGKTRLAIEIGRAEIESFKNGVYFVPLDGLESIEAILPAIAQSLNFSFHREGEPLQQLLEYTCDKQALLIMDNFEHLLQGTFIVTEILLASPRIKILCTSRIRLDIQGEQLFHLEGMDFPDWETPADAMGYSAVKLFLQSARRVRPDFELIADNLKYVARICRLAGGMPLGILLAAAWVEMLTPQEIAEEMQRSLDFLATEQKSIPERQRSMQAVFDYSWNLLTEREQEVFRGLSVFRGGFMREAAQGVTGATLRELMSLMDKSLLQRAHSGRYSVHELLRQYGEQKLKHAGKEHSLRQRHFEYFYSYTEPTSEEWEGSMQADWLHRLAAENDNIRGALDWCLESAQAETGLQLADWLSRFWVDRGYFTEAQDLEERLLALATQPTLARARGLLALSNIVHNKGDYEYTKKLAEEALAIAEGLGDRQAIADATFALSWPLLSLDQAEHSRHLLERSIELYQELNQSQRVAWAVTILGEIARARGDLARARELHEWSVSLHNKVEGRYHRSIALGNLALTLIHFGELERSQALLQESSSIDKERGTVNPFGLMALAFVANAKGQPLRATRLLGAEAALRKSMDRAVDPGDRPDYESNLASLRAQLDPATFESAWEEGAGMTYEQAIELALQEE